jgi:hypothetical protein
MGISYPTILRMMSIREAVIDELSSLMYAYLSVTKVRRSIATSIRWKSGQQSVLDALDALEARAADLMARLETAQDALMDDSGRVTSNGHELAARAHAFCREARFRINEVVGPYCVV